MSQPSSGTAVSAVPVARDLVRITQAFDFVARAHVDQRRKGEGAEPYINHLAEVAHLVAEATGGTDANLIIAALLHDAIEDVGVSRTQIADIFGEDVAALVAEVTDDKSLTKAERKQWQIEAAPKKSPRAKIIKIADKVANLRSIAVSPPPDWSEDQKREYVWWSSQVVAGCAGVNPWLEDQFAQACRSAKLPPAIDHDKESVADFLKRFEAIKAGLPEDFDDDQLKAHGAVDVTDDHRGLGIIIGQRHRTRGET
ncbi:HD domain-containing protein [Polaromonas sp. C04]|uniref:HD domain-containing protein n=1 Tax=Polaromonas sp. C04 TaxID=1945857 RepID=UPI000986AE88|nr:HD domain-containing protein [Polaromonas sp. C04]OOG58904.1 hypothetical protein B0E49_03140 [Polaromonas sp. C04]